MDYSEFKGNTIIDWLGYECFVVEVDPLNGITIRSIETNEDIYCLNKEDLWDAIDFDNDFEFTISNIIGGFLPTVDEWLEYHNVAGAIGYT